MKYNIRISYRTGGEELIQCELSEEDIQEIANVIDTAFTSDVAGSLSLPEKNSKEIIHFIRLSDVQHITFFETNTILPR